MLQQVELASTFFQLATTKFCCVTVFDWVVIRATTLFNLHRNNVALQVEETCFARITGPLSALIFYVVALYSRIQHHTHYNNDIIII